MKTLLPEVVESTRPKSLIFGNTIAATLIAAVAWAAFYKIGGVFASAPGVSAWFPAAGVAVIAGMVWGWPSVLGTILGQLGVLLVSPVVDLKFPELMYFVQYLRHSLVYAIAGFWLRNEVSRCWPNNPMGIVIAGLIAALSGSALAALIGTWLRTVASVTDLSGSLGYFAAFWIGDATGAISILGFAALFLARIAAKGRSADLDESWFMPARPVLSGLLFMAIAVTFAAFVLPQLLASSANLLFIVPLCGMMVALKFGFGGGTAFALASTLSLIGGVAIFGMPRPIFELQAYMLVALLGGIGVGAAVSDQRTAVRRALASRDALSHLSRIATANELVMGLSHQLTQPLTAAINSIELVKFKTAHSDERIAAPLILAQDECRRAAEIIDSFRAFVSRQELSYKAVDIRNIIDDSVRLIRGQLSAANVDLTIEVPKGPLSVFVSPIHIQQVFHNILTNAVDAMSGCEVRKIIIKAHAVARSIEVEIVDTGSGFDVAIYSSAQSPGSSKQGGLGFGLAICRTILEAHGSSLVLNSRIGEGTSCVFMLPTESEFMR